VVNARAQGNFTNGWAYTLVLLVTFWILYSYLVPISLFVTLEIVKFWQARGPPGALAHTCCTVSSIWPCTVAPGRLQRGCVRVTSRSALLILACGSAQACALYRGRHCPVDACLHDCASLRTLRGHAAGVQGFLYINYDEGMRDPATGDYARARNTNLNEDLGKVRSSGALHAVEQKGRCRVGCAWAAHRRAATTRHKTHACPAACLGCAAVH